MKVLGRAETIQQIRVSTPRGHFRFIRLSASTVGTLALWKSGYWGAIISASAFGSKVLQPLPSPSIWALSRSIHATTSFDAAVAVPGEIYSRAMNSLPHRN